MRAGGRGGGIPLPKAGQERRPSMVEGTMQRTRREFLTRMGGLGAAALVGRLLDDAIPRAAAAGAAAAARPADELAADEDYWREIQQAFAVDRGIINLNNGGVSPSPRVVQDALRRHLEFSNQAPAYPMRQSLGPGIGA